MKMGKGIASGYVPAEITICGNCFHKDVCGDKDYLTENKCCDFADVEELAALKQAEREGRLYIASYKEGDTVYRINTNKRDQRYGVHEEQVTAVDVTVHVNGIIRPLEDLLPDREAAEAALAAMEGK